jgi:plastocyanin
MRTPSTCAALLVSAVLLALPYATQAQEHEDEATPGALVGFGTLPTTPLGPPPCAQTTATIGGPTDPCAYKLHVLSPEESTIQAGAEVTFQVHGGGHGIAIYMVDEHATREDIGKYLCPGDDPATKHGANDLHPCATAGAANAAALHTVKDGDGKVVLVVSPNVTNQHPDNRVWVLPGRLMSAGGMQFMNGGTTAANGQLVTYKFMESGRYLVICMNRSHFLNDWMFGFVNVE